MVFLFVFFLNEKFFDFYQHFLIFKPLKLNDCLVIGHKVNLVLLNAHSMAVFRLDLIDAYRIIVIPGVYFLYLILAIMISDIKYVSIVVHLHVYRSHFELLIHLQLVIILFCFILFIFETFT